VLVPGEPRHHGAGARPRHLPRHRLPLPRRGHHRARRSSPGPARSITASPSGRSAHVILDGKIFSADRLAEKATSAKGEQIDLWYSGKAHEPGGNIQALLSPDGFPLWVSDVEPGSVHDLTAAREHVLGALCWAYSQLDLSTLADNGYDGAGIGVFTPVKQPANGQTLDPDTRTYNALLRGLRCLGERGFALLTGRWRALQHFTASPRKIGHIVKAALVLTHFEHGRLT
jgi:hypothetical protein